MRADLRRLFKGVVGSEDADLEEQAMRAVRRRDRLRLRAEAEQRRAELRLAAVQARKKHQMLAAEYARDRRTTT